MNSSRDITGVVLYMGDKKVGLNARRWALPVNVLF